MKSMRKPILFNYHGFFLVTQSRNWSQITEVESKTQSSMPRNDFSRTDPLETKDRNGLGQDQGQGQECSKNFGWQIFYHKHEKVKDILLC